MRFLRVDPEVAEHLREGDERGVGSGFRLEGRPGCAHHGLPLVRHCPEPLRAGRSEAIVLPARAERRIVVMDVNPTRAPKSRQDRIDRSCGNFLPAVFEKQFLQLVAVALPLSEMSHQPQFDQPFAHLHCPLLH